MKNLKAKLNKQGGFTLVEMLIVVAIIAILIAIAIPMVNKSLERAREATDAANMRAAVGLAYIEVLTENGLPDASGGNTASTAYYKIANDEGSLVAAKPTGYGKGYAGIGEDNTGHVNQVIQLTVQADGSIKGEWVD